MDGRTRIRAALDYAKPDVLPVRIYAADGGLHEHGGRLAGLIERCGHDFGSTDTVPQPEPPGPEDHDADGGYHAFRTDAWGTRWEYRIFGIWGHPCAWPLNDVGRLDDYVPPPGPVIGGPAFEQALAAASTHKRCYYLLAPGGSLFEKMHSLRRFEDVLMDVTCGTPEIHRIADLIMENVTAEVVHSLALDADGVAFGDDFGTQSDMLMSPQVWRDFFKPRYRDLFAPILEAGKDIFFHCCGRVDPIIPDLRELGVKVIWPQLTAYDLPELASLCRDLDLAIELHPDRGDLMQSAPPEQVRSYLHHLFDLFRTAEGGSWLYIEVDPGFAFANVETLFDVAMQMRRP